MKKNWHTKWLVVVMLMLAGIWFTASAQPIFAQDVTVQSLGVAHYVSIANPEGLRDGQIISHVENEYRISSGEFDKNIIGVYVEAPAMAMEPEITDNQFPIITSGNVEVLVNSRGGAIRRGDYITTSTDSGIGMRASKSGFMLGVAQQDFEGGDGEIGRITVMMDIKFAYGPDTPGSEVIISRILTVVSASRLAAIEDPAVAFRTMLAAVLVIASIIVAFLTFARVAQKGIDALGRNPLAGRMITVGIILNLGISIVIIAAGCAAAYVVISL